MKNKIVALCGMPASGKTTVAKELVSRGFHNLRTQTTRMKRAGEKQGDPYDFITEENFRKNQEMGLYAETAVYHAAFGTVYYGSLKTSYENAEGKNVIILNPEGIRAIRAKGIPLTCVFLSTDEGTLLERMKTRGDMAEEIHRRIEEDKQYFKGIEELADLTIETGNMSVKEIADIIAEFVDSGYTEQVNQPTTDVIGKANNHESRACGSKRFDLAYHLD